MNYKLFDDFITLQAILKRTRYYTEWWCNQSFSSRKEVFVNGELEQRRP